eukprot:TRINITY_DN1860_c0_g1_i1.p1 TRINITY_DN1860_c0_g1~~TRINITY_DN1860_c0_g1_i1.p1  ORF type:complete len:198 (-),score=22.07 TRINITY_DN1860_c0_g1_i1:38-601(-)
MNTLTLAVLLVAVCISCSYARPVQDLETENNMLCMGCELIVSWVEDNDGVNATTQIVTDQLHKVCKTLPSFLNQTCHSVIDQYGPLLVQYIVDKYNPETVCKMVGLCDAPDASMALMATFLSDSDVTVKPKNTECLVCQSIQELALTHDVPLSSTCKVLPEQHRMICREITEVFMALPPSKLCLHVC